MFVRKVKWFLYINIYFFISAELYLNLNRNFSDEVFNEFYEDAAVVFASITNFSIEEMGQGFLKIMSTIISEFDLVNIYIIYIYACQCYLLFFVL